MGSKNQSRWNHHPDLPISVSPLFAWPLQPVAWLRWLASYWLAISAVTLELLAAFIVYRFFQADWDTMKTLSISWVGAVWIRNLVLLTLVAGGLHLWFYVFRAQQDNLKFESRDPTKQARSFTFGRQVWDNMFWSYASGVSAWTAWEVIYFWAAANEYAPRLSFASHPVLFLLWFVLIVLWSSFHFYWVHRLLHWKPLYTLAHRIHHRNICIGPWSGISMHPIETTLYFSSLAIHFLIPSSPLHVLFHCYLQGLNPAFSHSGFEAAVVRDKKRIRTGDFFHQLHHRFFDCNYGTAEMPWDKLFGSFHDGRDEARKQIRSR